MKTSRAVAAVIAGLAVILAGLAIMITLKSGPDSEDRRADCMYAAVKAYPDAELKAGERIYAQVPACKDLSTKDKTEVRDALVEFVESAFMKSTE